MPKMTVHEVLMSINSVRKLTCPPTDGSTPPKVVSFEKVLEADQILLDLQERLLDDYGDAPQSTTL